MSMIKKTDTKEINPVTYAWNIVTINLDLIKNRSLMNEMINDVLAWCTGTHINDKGETVENHKLLPSGHIDELAKIDDRFTQYKR